MHIQLLLVDDPALEILIYLAAAFVAALIFAAILRWIFGVGKFLNNQRVIGNTLIEILAELKAIRKERGERP